MIKTYILSSYAALQTEQHPDLQVIANAVQQVGGTSAVLAQTVIAVLEQTQYYKLIALDVVMDNDKCLLDLTH